MATDNALLRLGRSVLAPSDSGDVVEWCEDNILAIPDSPMPGPFRSERTPWIAEALGKEAVVDWMSHVLDPQLGRVERWYLPGSHSLNFLLENALGGGGIASLRIDPQGKAFAQQLLEIPIAVPQHIADQLT